MGKIAALYARVSSNQQKEQQTIQSQTAALIEYANTNGYVVPSGWQFQDEGFSGATLLRPGLEAIRDLAATGQIAAVLVYSPDRLSRKYAYQVLLAEEFARVGVELVFLQAPTGTTPEDQLLLQFQGMIAEYERAQIAERSRRGKRHRALQGSVNVMSAAPYGYRYVKKTDTSAAYYQIVDTEAGVIGKMFDWYTRQGFSIEAITRELNRLQIPTRGGQRPWLRSTVWCILRNPAYCGRACFGKSQARRSQRINRRTRQGSGVSLHGSGQERPRQEWIEIPVPALISEETFALAEEQLEKNKRFASRRARRPILLQGMLICKQCGYALCSVSGGDGPYRHYYYRCVGSQSFRNFAGPLCQNRAVRQEYLDDVIWREIVGLLQDPALIQHEIERRMQEAKKADPVRQREQILEREQAHLHSQIDRLLTAYQEELLTLEQLRERIPELQKQKNAAECELKSLRTATQDQSRYLRVVDTLNQFRAHLQGNADRLDLTARRKIIRLLVKEILVGTDTITIRHSIPLANGPSPPPDSTPLAAAKSASSENYPLRTRSARGKMAHRHGKAGFIGKLLQLHLPQAQAAAVASTAIGGNQ
jgi:site-specific DNA recombinase